MSIYSWPNIAGALSVLLIGLVVFSKNKKSNIRFPFFLLCLELFVWLASYAVTYSTKNTSVAYIFCRIACTSVMFTTPTIYLFFACFVKKFEQEKVYIYICFLLMLIMFPFFIFTKLFLDDPHKYPWGYYSMAGPLHPFYLVIWVAVWCKGLTMFFDRKMWITTDLLEQHKNKVTLVLYFVVTLGIVDYIPKYGVNWYPWGWIFEVMFASIVAYAIIKYRFMDITLAITRTGIFVVVYSFVLGIPFALAFGWRERLITLIGEMWWMVPLVSSTVLATAGPFIYLYIQKRAEDRLLREQRRYQSTLRQASSGMSRIKDLKRLLNLIVRIVSRTVNLEHSAIYLFDDTEKKYLLGASRNRSKQKLSGIIERNSSLAKYLANSEEPIVYEEIKQRNQDYSDSELKKVELELENLDAALVVPSFVEKRLLGFIVLGKKRTGKLYSQDDLAVFQILANQAALAIENAQFYEDAKRTQEQLFQAEKMATIGTMADGLSHQINNRLHALGFIAGDTLDSINLKKSIKVTPEIKKLLAEIKHSLERIQDNVKQGGEIVQGLLKYTRKGDAGHGPIDLDDLINASLEMAQYKVKLDQLSIIREYPKDLPKIHGNFTQLQEVFFNLIDNAYDAIMQRKDEIKEPGYIGKLHISARQPDGFLEINVLDNGAGVREEDQNKLFTPFFTTKISSRKGTGLGLYVIQKIVEENHKGKVSISSEYMTGTLVSIRLPIASQ